MKLRGADIQRALRALPPAIRAVLVFGPDAPQQRDRIRQLALQKVARLDDPFNVAELAGASVAARPGLLSDEAAALSMMGGERVVIVRDADEAIVPALNQALGSSAASALMLLHGGNLGAPDKLRRLAEASPQILALACYPESAQAITRLLIEDAEVQGRLLMPDAAQFLVDGASGNREVARQELEKLMLYAGDSRAPLSLALAREVAVPGSESALSDLVQHVCDKKAASADRLSLQLLERGEEPVVLLRALSRRLWMFAAAHAAQAAGQSPGECADRLFGRMAWKEKEPFLRQLQRWPLPRVEQGLARLNRAERDIKDYSLPAGIIAARCVLALSR